MSSSPLGNVSSIGMNVDQPLANVKTIFVGGSWRAAPDGGVLPMHAPADGRLIGHISRGTAADVDAAVTAAQAALASPAWAGLSAAQRGRLLMALSRRVLEEVERLAWLEAHDTGKPIGLARGDMQVLARYLEFYAGAADKVHGEVIPFEPGYTVTVSREPLGVTAHIIPWNYPAQMFGRSLAPALAMGNAVVLKPSEDACMSCLAVAELAQEVGFPAGAINVVTGLGAEAGAALSAHPDVRLVTFTGSSEVGALVQAAAARHHVPVTLELGGKSPQIVFADADLERAADAVVRGIVQNAGQTCSAGSRVLVERSVFAAFAERLASRFAAVRLGTPEDNADLGPLINASQRQRVERFVAQARADGIAVIAETPLPDDLPPQGLFVAPVVFGPVHAWHPLAREEVFGPVLCAMPFEDEVDAIRLANDTDFGLVAAVWTRDGDRQARLARRIQSGQFFINCYGAGGGVELPFGGVKRSGHGREKGMAALEEMSVTKTVVHFHG
jgi:aldehyde dehydrogenase (NAD+)